MDLNNREFARVKPKGDYTNIRAGAGIDHEIVAKLEGPAYAWRTVETENASGYDWRHYEFWDDGWNNGLPSGWLADGVLEFDEPEEVYYEPGDEIIYVDGDFVGATGAVVSSYTERGMVFLRVDTDGDGQPNADFPQILVVSLDDYNPPVDPPTEPDPPPPVDDARIAALEARVAELEALLAELEAKIGNHYRAGFTWMLEGAEAFGVSTLDVIGE